MKSNRKTLFQRISSLVITAALSVQLVSVPGMAVTAFAAGTDAEAAAATASVRTDSNRVTALLSGYTPTVTEVVNPDSGFTHPGVGVTKELLDNVQTQVRNGTEPWKSYFETMLLDRTDLTGKNVSPSWNRVDYTQQSQNGAFKKDASTAYAQAVMYYITGDNAYRSNALRIIRAYENVDPEQMAYFNDACIHTGVPTNRMCIAAEILRYSSYQVSDGYTEAELKWTDEDTEKFISNFLSPEVEVFQYSPDRFMNQHLYTTIGAMSAYLFMDDAESYEKAVEWFTVNRGGVNQGSTGSIQRLFREITTVDEIGGKEGAGPKLSTPVIQHMEMGRDQAHGCGDLTNSAILARLMQGQGTKVDPGDGTVSTALCAVDCYTFLNDRLVKAADFFFEYMLGYDAEWVPAPYSIGRDGNIIAMYAGFSTEYRGRYTTINFWDFYAYYRYDRNMTPEAIQAAYPYFYEGYGKKLYAAWDNDDGGGDFWLFLPAAAAGDTSFIPASGEDNVIDVTVRGTVVSDRAYAGIETASGETYVHITPSEAGSVICVNTAGIGAGTVLFKVRTNCVAKLNVTGDVYLPDTGGQWAYVSYDCPGLGDIYYLTVSDLPSGANAYVDISGIYTNPTASGLSAVVFDSGSEDCSVSTYAGAAFSMAFPAEDAVKGAAVSYSLVNAPDTAAVGADGRVTWTPGAAGDVSFYVMAKAGDSVALKRIHATVAADRAAALANVLSDYDANTAYITASRKDFDRIRSEIEPMVNDTTVTEEVFSAKLSELADAVAKLELVSPPLLNDPLTKDDPDGPSLDFRDMNLGNRSTLTNPAVSYPGLWLDNNPSSFVQYTQVETVNGRRSAIIDFGVDYKISVNKFGFQARAGFPSRVGGVQVFGSNDRLEWELLTDGQAENISDYQTVNVLDEVKENQYRYLMIQKTTLYPDATSGIADSLLEFGEMRIWGTRYETGNLIESISMTSDDLKNGCIQMGSTVKVTIQGRDELKDLTVSINGVSAAITEGADHLYTATAVMSSDRCAAGNVSLEVNYTKLDGTAGAPFYGTTDGTTLLLVNSDAFIDTGRLAAALYASSNAWGGGEGSGVEAAGRLFDGDITKWGELSNREGDYYVVDFGENAKVALDDVMMMPRSTAADHAARLNGTVIYGSNDVEHENYADKEWTALTQSVSGAAMGIWSHASVSDHTPYRFFKITGGTLCCIGEVEFYGSYHSDVNSIAAQITSLPEQGALQSALLCPSLPAGFTFTVASSTDESVITKEGKLFAKADEDATVTVTLNIKDQSGNSAVTAPIDVTVKSLKSAVTGLSAAKRGAGTLALPEVPAGFTVTVKDSSNPSIVANGSGAITTPARDSLVNVTLVLTRTSDSVSAACGPYDVLVYGTQASGQLDVASLKAEWQPITTNGNDVTKVFDGDIDTFADLNSGNTHTVDFGETKVIPVKFRLYPRSDSNDTNAGRTNGTVIEGSHDGTTWVRLTEPVSGAKKGTWIEIDGTEFVNYGSFRYLRITGGTRGSLAELEVYGVVDTTAEALAATITSLPNVEAGETSLTLPTLPDGFTVAVASSSNTDVITAAGEVKLPMEDTEVNVTLTVTGPGNDTADTAAILVLVKGIPLTLENPSDTDTMLTLPTVPAGYTVAITGTDPAGVIAADGTITRSKAPVLVNVTLALKNAGGEVIKTETSRVLVNGTLQSVKLDVIGLANHMYASAAESWSGLNENQVARKLFDGDLTNHCEPNDKSESTTYTVDFGEGVRVSPTQFRLYPRSNDTATNAQRMNGTVVKGSNDGTNWVDITNPVAGAWISTWTEIGIEAFVGYGSYRYFQITGAKVGNIAEVEIYGVMEGTANALAAAIPAPSDVEPGEDLALPTMPSGYSITVSGSNPSGIIAADGTVTTPGNDTDVTAALQITDPDNVTATKNITVTVKGVALTLNNPGPDDTTLTLPSAPQGFTVSIVGTSNPAVINTNGSIIRSADPAVVEVTLVLSDAAGSEVKRAAFNVFVSGTEALKQVNVGLATVVASCKQWSNPAGNGLDENEIAALLFDGNTGTFGDLQDTNGYYTIDFGEGVAVLPAQFRLYPRSDTNFGRMNNTVIYGSNNGTDWEPITAPVAGTVKDQWYTIEADQFVNYGSYRYFKIAGGTGGNIAEVEIYGVVSGTEGGYLSDANTTGTFSMAAAVTEEPQEEGDDPTALSPEQEDAGAAGAGGEGTGSPEADAP